MLSYNGSLEDGTTVPKHVAAAVCHKWCITEYICWMMYWL